MGKNNGKVQFEKLEQTFVQINEGNANVPFVNSFI